MSEGPPELSGTTAILLVFQAHGQHERITDIYVGLVVNLVESRLYTPDQILEFVADIEVDLKVVHDTLKARSDPSKRRAFCLFVSNYGGAMSIPMDPPYCLIYPTSYMRDVEPDHFDTCNNPARTHLCHCICHTTLQHMNDDPSQHREYARSCLILPCRAQYKERLCLKILEPWNHWVPLTDSITKEPFLMELMGDFRSMDPIFKGCYGDSFLYLGQLRWHGIHLPLYWNEILAPPAPSYLQAKQPKATKWSPPWAMTLNPAVESPKAKCSGGKGRHHHSSGRSSNTSTLKCTDSTSAKKPSSSKEPAPNEQEKSPRSCGSCKCGHSPSPSTESVRHKRKEVCSEETHALNSTLLISSSEFDGFRSPMGSNSNVTELQPPSITLTPLGLGAPRLWRTTSEESRHLLASLYTSPGFNLSGYPAAGPGNLMPSIPSRCVWG